MKRILSIASCMLLLASLPGCKGLACKKAEEAPRTESYSPAPMTSTAVTEEAPKVS